MIEKDIVIKAHDGKDIIAKHAFAEDKKSDKVVMLAHGLTGHKDEYIHIIATEFFTEKGYDVLRFDFYNGEGNARTLDETTLAIQGQDLNTVINSIRADYKKIFVCGHSYGGATLLFSQPDVTALAFWDSSFVAEVIWRDQATYIPQLDQYYLPWGTKSLVGKAMYEEGMALTNEKAVKKAQNIKPPSLIVNADTSWELEEYAGRELVAALECEKKHVIIENCDHCFLSRRRVMDLCEHTYDWFQKY